MSNEPYFVHNRATGGFTPGNPEAEAIFADAAGQTLRLKCLEMALAVVGDRVGLVDNETFSKSVLVVAAAFERYVTGGE